MLFNGRC